MTTLVQTLSLAMRSHQAGDLKQAESLYRQILQKDPQHIDALHLLGLIAHQMGRHDLAADYIGRSLRLKPDFAEAHHNLGLVLRAQGQLAEAMACWQQALRYKPNYAEAHNNLGNVHTEQGRLPEAMSCYQQALRLKPDYAQAHYNLGCVQAAQGQVAEAVASYQQALGFQPDHAGAHHNLGNALAAQGKLEEALSCYQLALRFQPESADAHSNLATTLQELGLVVEAEKHFQEALRIRPTNRVRALFATLLPTVYQSVEDILVWRQRLTDNVRRLHQEHFTLDLTHEAGQPSWYLAYQGFNDREVQRDLAGLYTAPQLPLPSVRPLGRGESARVRVGFISRDFRFHTIGTLMRGLIANLSRRLFHVTVLSVESTDDAITRFIREHADTFLEVPQQLPAARRLIAEQGLDVLLYTDIGLSGITYSLAFSRLAPVQCVTWGHGVTTGIPTIDYFISSALLETDQGPSHYTEKLVCLPHLGIYFYRPELPSPLRGRSHFGLPEQSHLYACLHPPFRLHPDFDAVLGGILRRDRKGILVLLRSKHSSWVELLQRRLAVGLADVLERIYWLPALGHQDFLNLNAVTDVLLDPLHLVGGRTSLEGLAMGTPIVTLPTELLRGRITWALYALMGVWDCVASSAEDYVDKAVRLGTDAAYRAEVSGKIQAANPVLFENAAGVRELEQFLLQAVARAGPT